MEMDGQLTFEFSKRPTIKGCPLPDKIDTKKDTKVE